MRRGTTPACRRSNPIRRRCRQPAVDRATRPPSAVQIAISPDRPGRSATRCTHDVVSFHQHALGSYSSPSGTRRLRWRAGKRSGKSAPGRRGTGTADRPADAGVGRAAGPGRCHGRPGELLGVAAGEADQGGAQQPGVLHHRVLRRRGGHRHDWHLRAAHGGCGCTWTTRTPPTRRSCGRCSASWTWARPPEVGPMFSATDSDTM